MGSRSVDEESPSRQRASRLREALRRREVKKLYSLALDLGVDQSAISRWTKDGGMSLDHATALCSHLNLSLDWLIFGRGGMEPQGRNEKVAALADMLESFEPEVIASFLTIAEAILGRR